MQIINALNIDLRNQSQPQRIRVMQADANTRILEAHLYSGDEVWPVPEGISVALSYCKPDGTVGLYDKLPDGTAALAVSENSITAVLAPQMLTVAGLVLAVMILKDTNGKQLSTFPFQIHVEKNPAAGVTVSDHYINVASAIGNLEDLATTDKSSLVAAINEAVNASTVEVSETQIAQAVADYFHKYPVAGKDGFSPIATVEQTETGAVVSITDQNGTTTAAITNGKDGVDGEKGDTGKTGPQGPQGEKGDKGEPGKDGSDANVTAQNIASALGYTPANDADVDSLASNQATLFARMDVFTTLKEGSTTGDAELMDARLDCEGNTWPNAGEHIRGITEKIIDACCDKVVVEGGNYNLYKISEVSFSSRLQNDVEGITTSTAQNIVTGWIPVKYGKYYSLTVLYEGVRGTYSPSKSESIYPTRLNVKKADGTILVYNKDSDELNALFCGEYNTRAITIPVEDVVAIRIHHQVYTLDVSTADKLAVYEPMFVEGDTPEEAFTNSVNFAYIDGDKEIPSEMKYTLRHDSTKVDKIFLNPYFRDVNFGVIPTSYYQGVGISYDAESFVRSTTYADFIAAWKSLVANHSTYVTETELGKASDEQSIYLYDFKPVRITNQKKPIPKIIIIAGQHGWEKANVYGLYYFVDNLLNRWHQHPALDYLRHHVELMIVPVVNTYGFDALEYKNANGVNINRNYSSNWVLVEDTDSAQYGGAEPFDQPESQIIRYLIQANTDASMVVDYHVCAQLSAESYDKLTYLGVCESTDSYYNRMLDVAAQHLSSISAHFNIDYELNEPNAIMGYLNTHSGNGILRKWVTDNNIIGVLVEGLSGFPNDTPFVDKVYKADEEHLVNYLMTALNYLAK